MDSHRSQGLNQPRQGMNLLKQRAQGESCPQTSGSGRIRCLASSNRSQSELLLEVWLVLWDNDSMVAVRRPVLDKWAVYNVKSMRWLSWRHLGLCNILRCRQVFQVISGIFPKSRVHLFILASDESFWKKGNVSNLDQTSYQHFPKSWGLLSIKNSNKQNIESNMYGGVVL